MVFHTETKINSKKYLSIIFFLYRLKYYNIFIVKILTKLYVLILKLIRISVLMNTYCVIVQKYYSRGIINYY